MKLHQTRRSPFAVFGLILLCVLTVCVCSVASAKQEYGNFNADGSVTWILDTDGVLHISGTGVIESGGPKKDKIKRLMIYEGITGMSEGLFSSCRNLSYASFPSTMTELPRRALYGDTSLRSVKLPEKLTVLGEGALESCSYLAAADLSATLKEIGARAFAGCGSLTAVTVPKGLEAIGRDAFLNCPAIRYATIGSIGARTLGKAGYSFRTDGGRVDYQYMYTGDTLTGLAVIGADSGIYEATVQEGATEITASAFRSCTALKTLKLPKSLTAIADGALSGCSSLKKIEVPNKTCYAYSWCVSNGYRGILSVSGGSASSDPIDLGNATIREIPDQVWTGKEIRPALIVVCDGVVLTVETDYTTVYSNNTEVGKAAVVVTGCGDYTGTKKSAFSIVPQAVKLSSLKAGKNELTVSWKKGKQADGYEIQYSLEKDFTGAKKKTVSGVSVTKQKLTKLESGKLYYVRVRGWKKVSGKKYYSDWSNTLSKKTK